MSEADSFTDFIRRIRDGDEDAAAELVRRYEPFIRREVRFRMRDARLRRVFDSMDICQTVLKSFFVRAAAGQFELDQDEDLPRLLVGMVRNRVAEEVRKQGRQRRDYRLVADGSAALNAAAGQLPTPSRVLAGKELLAEVRQRLSEEERQMADLRGQGTPWDEIAGLLGGTAQARRVQLKRALDRVSAELGLEESCA